jgi:multidrug efflux pump subunit AcrB
MMGPYMSPIPILGSVAMVISLFAAFAFTPWLTYRFKPKLSNLDEAAAKEHRQAAVVEKIFRSIIIPLIRDTRKGYALIAAIVIIFFLFMGLFYTKDVKVKMLPLDNKPEFNIVINFPEGTALPITANFTDKLALVMKEVPEVTALQSYVGTASPFNFNGFVRHYYLRQSPWQADIQVQLSAKNDRERSSHQIADEARAKLTPLAKAAGARIQIVEMPPGPPVLQSVVAEIYGPDAETRRKVARDVTKIFEQAEHLGDVDNLMEAQHTILRFHVDTEKAQRNNISVDDINRSVEMTMGGFVLGDIKPHPDMSQRQLESTPIIIQVPLAVRSQINRLIQLPVSNRAGQRVALSELGYFSQEIEDAPIYHKDLRPVEFVTAETIGDLAAPVYGQFEVEEILKQSGYRTPDNVELKTFWGILDSAEETTSQFDWGGEWTVTWQTFHDMGIAFIGALILIYMVIVAQFGNFVLPAVIMAPIPLTLIGIMPGHWLMGADFSATSMIGFIALAGIIVRNSILLVDFSRQCVHEGMSVTEAVIKACEARTRPIAITALALIGGSLVILDDPIFQGMAVSLIFGGAVSTLLTLLVIPLGCISAGKALIGDVDVSKKTAQK